MGQSNSILGRGRKFNRWVGAHVNLSIARGWCNAIMGWRNHSEIEPPSLTLSLSHCIFHPSIHPIFNVTSAFLGIIWQARASSLHFWSTKPRTLFAFCMNATRVSPRVCVIMFVLWYYLSGVQDRYFSFPYPGIKSMLSGFKHKFESLKLWPTETGTATSTTSTTHNNNINSSEQTLSLSIKLDT